MHVCLWTSRTVDVSYLTCRLVSIMSTLALSQGNTTWSQAFNKSILLHPTDPVAVLLKSKSAKESAKV